MNPIDLRVYLVTDTRLCGDRGVRETVRQAVQGGATVVQLRDHDASTRDVCAMGEALRDELAETGVPLIVDDRVDVAVAIGADGVHLGQSDLDPRLARRVCGPELLIGYSVSTAAETRAAADLPIDYVGVGPYRATPTKPDAARPLGDDGIAEVIAAGTVPAVVIGGVTASDVAAVRAAGASGVAVVSAVCAADRPDEAVARLRRRWEEAR